MIDTAYAAMSRARAKHLVEEGVKGAVRVEQILADPAPTIATAQFLCLTFEALAVATIGVRVYSLVDSLAARLLITAAIAVVLLFIVVGVGGRTLGRQHAMSVTLRTGRIMSLLTTVLFLALIHISEPTRLLSISYAVFCLKKKNKRTKTTDLHTTQ